MESAQTAHSSKTLGVGIIARNAESTIGDCIASFIDHVDQCVVVLAGKSTDKTEEIVRSFPRVEVHNFEWIDDFAAARNYCFSFLNTDWLLWVDSDDVVYQPDRMKRLIENANPDVGAIWLSYHYAIDEFGNPTTIYERERLLRSCFGWIWQGRLHETVAPLNQCKFVRSDEVIIRHDHQAGGSRNDRNFRILEIMHRENPDDKRVWLYLGHQHFAGGMYGKAAEWYLKFGQDRDAIPVERYQALCYASKALREIGDSQAAEVALAAIEILPQYRDAYLEVAHAYLVIKDYDKAIHWATLSESEILMQPPSVIFINPMEYTFNKYAMLSECYMNKGDFKKAIEFMQRAYRVRPTEDVKTNIEYQMMLDERNKISNAVKMLSVHLLDTKELVKLKVLLNCVPYWMRDLPDYKQLMGGVEHFTSKIKDEPTIVETDNKSVIVNIGNSVNPHSLIDQMDKKYDRVTVIAPLPTPESDQINSYSQLDMELMVASPTRHLLNLQREPTRLICEYDKNPSKRLAVRTYVGQGLEYWSPKTIKEQGCGGSETAVAMLSHNLAKQDCQPIVYAMDNQVWDGVIYRHYSDYHPKKTQSHIFISSRTPEIFNDNIPCEQKWLWVHDISCFQRLTPEIAERIDVILALSHWHVGHLKRSYPWLKEAKVIDLDNNAVTYEDNWTGQVYDSDYKPNKLPTIAIFGNGTDTARFKEITEKRIPYRFFWGSSPDRGLEQVLDMWPLIKKRMPEATLKIFYGWNYFDHSLFMPKQRELKDKIKRLIQQEGIEWCGRVGQDQLAIELQKSDAILYPPPHDFRETYGIIFLEAQAAGCLCFYRKNGALGETIGDRGIPLDLGMPPESIVEKVAVSLESNTEGLRARGREYAMKRDWSVQTQKALNLYELIKKGG